MLEMLATVLLFNQEPWWPGTGSNRRHADFQSSAISYITVAYNEKLCQTCTDASIGYEAIVKPIHTLPNPMRSKWLAVYKDIYRGGDDTPSEAMDRYKNYKYVSDKKDAWLTPAQFEKRGYGDCEDFAIASLSRVKGEKWLVVGNRHGEIHAVAYVRSEGKIYALDIFLSEPVEISEHDFQPLIILGKDGWSLFNGTTPPQLQLP